MTRACIVILFLLLSSVAWAETSEPLCVLSPDDMPKSWRPSAKQMKKLNPAPWSEKEAKDAVYAINKGLQQMIDHYAKEPDAIEELWEDSVGSVVEVSYSGSNMPDIQAKGREAARHNLTKLIGPFLKRDPKSAKCGEWEDTLPLTIYTRNLFKPDDPRIAKMVAFTNAAYKKCGSLKAAMKYDYQAMLKKKNVSGETVFDAVIWSLLLIEAELVPGLEMPKGASEFSPAFWKYLETYPMPGAIKFKKGAWDEKFIDTAYLATHIAYIPTGNHRHPLYIEDSPKLYHYIRDNFYPVLEMGELDLVAEFVDTLRQYGCNDENDMQVRDGARYLLNLFHSLKDDWSAYREPGETDAEVEDYDLIHKPWTGISGVRIRVWEPADPGTYGGVVRKWLPAPN